MEKPLQLLLSVCNHGSLMRRRAGGGEASPPPRTSKGYYQCDSEGGRRALSNGPPSDVMDGWKAALCARACDLACGFVPRRSILLTQRRGRGGADQPEPRRHSGLLWRWRTLRVKARHERRPPCPTTPTTPQTRQKQPYADESSDISQLILSTVVTTPLQV